MRGKLQEWEENSNRFIRTKAYEKVLGKISSQSCVAVTGSSGSGKNAIVEQVAVSLCNENGYKMIMITEPFELKTYYTPGRKTLFIHKDLCGKITANEDQINKWDLMKYVVDQVIKDNSCKLLFSCRLQVYNDSKFALLQTFTSCECNIISDELCLTTVEKKAIFKSYLESKYIEDDILSLTFPFLCQQYPTGEDKYFEMIYAAYEAEFDLLRGHAKTKFCGLCLCIIFNNQLKEIYFQIRSPEFTKIVKDTCYHIGLPRTTSATCLRDELDTLDKTYINKHDGLYKICHANLFDFMACYFGKKFPQYFIQHADNSFLRERFLCLKAFPSENCPKEKIVYIEDKFLPFYIKRMISDWKKGKISDVFYNIHMKCVSFRKEFLECLHEIDKNEAVDLANKKNCDIDDSASDDTPLIISALLGYVDIMKWLIDNEATINYQREDGASALSMACEKNYDDAVNVLLENKADVNLCTEEGASPLAIVCYFHGNTHIIIELLNRGADVNGLNLKKNNMTPLIMASQKNFESAALTLLDKGADHRICLKNGMSALLVACQKRYKKLVTLLLEKDADPNVVKKDGNTPLFSACAMGFADIAELLLANGADISKCVYSKQSIIKALHETPKSLNRVKKSWVKIAKSFGSRKTNDFIARIGRNKILDYVFNVIAGSSPLHVACFMGHIDIVHLILSKRLPRVDLRKENGITPLFYACEIGHIDIIKVLLENKAYHRISPLQIAKLNRNTGVLSLLKSYTR